MQITESTITGLQQRLNRHHIYRAVRKTEDQSSFIQHNVYSLWDFMTLIKYLQGILAPTDWPWLTAGDPRVQRFIN